MINFFYDSLDTVKKLKHPTRKEYINLTLAIIAVVIIAGLMFILFDTVFQELYRALYDIMA
jgi:preprotein translocase SecE subunit